MRLGLRALHEITKTHPRDWENPGRVRVQWKKDGKLVNPAVKTSECFLAALFLYDHCNPVLFRETVARNDMFPDTTPQA